MAWAAALCAGGAFVAATLCLCEVQCRRLESVLREDFCVIFFVKASTPADKLKITEERLRALPDVDDVKFVSADDALDQLRREDPDLVDAIALVGDNPLSPAFEVTPAVSVLPFLPAWIDNQRAIADWTEIRWKSPQLQALMRARLFAGWLRLVLRTLLCLTVGLLLCAAAWSWEKNRELGQMSAALWGALGGALGIAAAFGAAWPLRRDDALWSWPSAWMHVVIIAAAAALGWSMSLWRADS